MSKPVQLEIVKCNGCGALGVVIDDTRITGHKCSGSWQTVRQESIPESVLRVAGLVRAEEKAK